MSRTDIHRPLQALWQDPSMRSHFREEHDHRDGVCDLQRFLERWLTGDSWWPARGGCSVRWYSLGQRICSCAMCSQRAARYRTRRAQRQGTRRALRAAAGQWAAGQLDEDGPVPRRVELW
jgi:hypothetical protein